MRTEDDMQLIYKAIEQFNKDCIEQGYIFRMPRPVCSYKRNNMIYLKDLKGAIARYRILDDKSLMLIPYESQKKE